MNGCICTAKQVRETAVYNLRFLWPEERRVEVTACADDSFPCPKAPCIVEKICHTESNSACRQPCDVGFWRLSMEGRPVQDDKLVSLRPARTSIRSSVYCQRTRRKIPKAFPHFKPNVAKLFLQKSPSQYTELAKCYVVHREGDKLWSNKELRIWCEGRLWGFAVRSESALRWAVLH